MPYKDKAKQAEYWRGYQRRPKRVAYKKEWDAKNRGRMAELQRQRKARDPEKYRVYFRNNYLQKTYGITSDQYEQMFEQVGGKCEICSGPPDIKMHGITRLAIDHDHKTGAVRGLLCNNCNVGIGLIGDTEEHLLAAIEYLRRHASKEA